MGRPYPCGLCLLYRLPISHSTGYHDLDNLVAGQGPVVCFVFGTPWGSYPAGHAAGNGLFQQGDIPLWYHDYPSGCLKIFEMKLSSLLLWTSRNMFSRFSHQEIWSICQPVRCLSPAQLRFWLEWDYQLHKLVGTDYHWPGRLVNGDSAVGCYWYVDFHITDAGMYNWHLTTVANNDFLGCLSSTDWLSSRLLRY